MKKEIKNTIDDVVFKPFRGTGNTTRQVNKAIELLFEGYVVEVIDHAREEPSLAFDKALLDRIERRLQSEHCWVKYRVKTDGQKWTIELSK